MGFFKKLIGEAAAAPVKEIGKIIDNVHTSREEELNAEQKLTETVTALQRLQAQITISESKHRSVFVAGWRPGLAWLCVFILFFNYVVVPVMGVFEIKIEGIADPEHIENIVLALAGIASLRTIEKARGLTR